MHTPTITSLPSARTTRRVGRLLGFLLLALASFTGQAQSITGPDYVYVNTSNSPTGASTTYGALNGGSPSFDGAVLNNSATVGNGSTTAGTYVIGKANNAPDDILLFNGGRLTTVEPVNTAQSFKSARLYYRVFPRNNAGNTAFAAIALEEVANSTSNGLITRTFENTSQGIDLVSSVSGSGVYTVDVYLEASYVTINGTTQTQVVYQDNNSNSNKIALDYQASFTVTGTRNATTVWNGMRSDNWFDAGNWSNGIPNSAVDAFIPYPGPGSKVQYPKIYANGRYQVSNTSTTGLDYSGDADYGIATTRSLKFGGTSFTAKATVELVNGNLLIYKDFVGDYNNFLQDLGTIVTFAGNTSQSLSMLSNGDFKTVNITNTGIKTLTGNMNIATELHFGAVTLPGTTSGSAGSTTLTGTSMLITSGAGNLVTLQTNSTSNTDAARLTGETSDGYIFGNTTVKTVALVGMRQDFGNIGLALTFSAAGGSPDAVTVTRTTGQPFTGTNSTSGAYSIKRSFTVAPDKPNTTGNGLKADLEFNYLDADFMNIGPNNLTLDDSYFYLAFSANGTSFNSLGYTTRDSKASSKNLLTKVNVDRFATFTLADERTPLPVSLVAFTAKRSADVALIAWETAMERNNKGFEVEVSTDGVTFRTLGFVGSNSPDSNKRLSYTYTDAEASKSGVRYYRLHQIDYSGQDDYSPVRAVSFTAAGETVAALSAYPNPFSGDEIKLALQSDEAGQASLRITDLTGRPVSTQLFTAVKGVTEVSINQAATLAAGSYLAQITAPSGEVKTVRIQKR